MNTNQENFMRAVVPIFSDNGQFFAKLGTAFFIEYNQEFYAITASHCLHSIPNENIFLSLPLKGKELKALPLSEMIKSNYNDGLKTDTEITLLKLPLLETLQNKLKDFPILASQQILNTPYMKKQIKKFHKGKIQNPIQIFNSKFYQNIKRFYDSEIIKKVEEVYTPDLQILTLNITNSKIIPEGVECLLLGYPNKDFNIDYENNSINSLLHGITCKYKNFNKNTFDFIFEHNEDEKNLDGFSGGAIIYENNVIAMAHSFERETKTIKATPISSNIMKSIQKLY